MASCKHVVHKDTLQYDIHSGAHTYKLELTNCLKIEYKAVFNTAKN